MSEETYFICKNSVLPLLFACHPVTRHLSFTKSLSNASPCQVLCKVSRIQMCSLLVVAVTVVVITWYPLKMSLHRMKGPVEWNS